MKPSIQQFIGKHFQSFEILSQFFDMQFNFEGGYQLNTFFNWAEDNQWTLFLPNKTDFGIDCSTKESIKELQVMSKQVTIANTAKKLRFPEEDLLIKGIEYHENELPLFSCENNIFISFDCCAWRLEKNQDYVVGLMDDAERNEKLSKLIGKKLQRIYIVNWLMDAIFEFEEGYVLKTFSCCQVEQQWEIYQGDYTLFLACIELLEE